ncbi:hypothetical protein [Gellertiella hungarica]|uniref:Uncharacterized protein n=1 Tax=Gellertiella hungarica TaxID=1572859 RepID=A0A7W6J996_9HYPH|nr:hypothetical protein [Gellertiella hungarica]MBB4067159.1 hypothetical protein [Gellertiella hungarica]
MAKSAKNKANKEVDERVEKYNAVVRAAELLHVRLIDLNFDVQPELYVTAPEDRDLGYIIKVMSAHYDEESGLAACFVDAEVTAHKAIQKSDLDASPEEEQRVDGNHESGDDEEADPLVIAKARYSVAYGIEEKCDEEAVKMFLRRVGEFTCYPYFRSLVAQLDWAADTSLPPLPVHKERGLKGDAKP